MINTIRKNTIHCQRVLRSGVKVCNLCCVYWVLQYKYVYYLLCMGAWREPNSWAEYERPMELSRVTSSFHDFNFAIFAISWFQLREFTILTWRLLNWNRQLANLWCCNCDFVMLLKSWNRDIVILSRWNREFVQQKWWNNKYLISPPILRSRMVQCLTHNRLVQFWIHPTPSV